MKYKHVARKNLQNPQAPRKLFGFSLLNLFICMVVFADCKNNNSDENFLLVMQTKLAFGANDDVIREVERRKKIFPKGGLFVGPTHAIQVGSPIENIIALYRAAGSMVETIDESILSVVEGKNVQEINMSKLF